MPAKKFLKNTIIKLLTGKSADDYANLANQLTLADAIEKIDHLFGCQYILNELDSNFTISYYNQSEWGYRTYHSQEGSIHLSLNPDGVFDPDGYYTQPRVVAEQIRELDAKNVLELGSGKGFNSCFLAQQFPEVQFTGIDLTPLHIKIANQKSDKFSNLSFQEGNFNSLRFPNKSFDVVFAFECLCYAPQPEIPLAEVFRVLRPGGQLIIFDGYRKIKLDKLPQLLQNAVQLTEISMAVSEGFVEADNCKTTAQSIGFRVQSMEDLTLAVRPNLLKLQKLSLKFFLLPSLAKIFIPLVPKYLAMNSVAGLLMPFVFSSDQEVCGYYKFILERPLD